MFPKITKKGWKSSGCEGLEYSVDELKSDISFTSSNTKFAKEFRKATAVSSVDALCSIFKDGKFKEKVEWDLYSMENTCVYIDKCIECLWLMCVQDPPMYIMWLEPGHPHDPANFSVFATPGKKVEYTVWPAVFLHKNGPLITKGYVKLC